EVMEKLEFEKEILGIYVSGHPLDRFYDKFKEIDYVKSIDFSTLKGSGEILSIGKIESFKSMMSKNNKRYGRLEILDFYSTFEVTVFESNIEEIENILKNEASKNEAYGFLLSYKAEEGKLDSLALRSIKTLEGLQEGEIKAVKKFNAKKNTQENKDFIAEPKEFENNIIELDLSRLNRELVYEIHEIARSAHNPNEKGNKKLVLKIVSTGSCLLYHTDFVISDSVSEKIINKYAG
ncbi:DNA polymerase III subunit alpha, partial [Campylobacter coli]